MTAKKHVNSDNSKKAAPAVSLKSQRKDRAHPTEKYRTLILFGMDADKKPRAAWFTGDELGLLVKAADAMDLIMCDAKTPQLAELARKLPAGRLGASGATFVPFVRQDLYDQLVKAAGSDADRPTTPPMNDSIPRTFEEIGPVMSSLPRRAWNSDGGKRSCLSATVTCSHCAIVTIQGFRSFSARALPSPY